MKPTFHARLINGPFGDPGLYVRLQWERRALIFDLGSINSLAPGEILKISDVFITHTHVDHFIGFDYLIRVLLGRDKIIRIYGPPGIIGNIEGRLAGYTWNLVEDYPLSLEVHEVHEDRIYLTTFACREGFLRKDNPAFRPFKGTLLEEPFFSIEATHLDHRIPSLAFSLSEKFHININKNCLRKLDLPVGPWLGELKRWIQEGRPDDTVFVAKWRKDGRQEEREFLLGELKRQIVSIAKGQKIAYIVDALFNPRNIEKIVSLARDSDILYCEAAYLDRDKERAMERYHLTAKQAGILAREAGAKRLIIFHFSPKYYRNEEELYLEAAEAFGSL